MRHINDATLAEIKRNEGLRLSAYRDVAGVWTIGYGHTPAHPGSTITEEQATQLLKDDILRFEIAVDNATHDVPTTDAQFSAMVSLAFNIGTGAFLQSSVVRKHRAGDHQGAAVAFMLWDKAHVNGQLVVVSGLMRRRNEERVMYLSNPPAPKVAPPSPPEPVQAPKPVPAATPSEIPQPPNTGLLSFLDALRIWK